LDNLLYLVSLCTIIGGLIIGEVFKSLIKKPTFVQNVTLFAFIFVFLFTLTLTNLSQITVVGYKSIQTQFNVNADDPLPYVELGSWNENLGRLTQIIVNGTTAYIAGFSADLFIFDLENLSNPLLLNTYRSGSLPYNINDILFINESLIILAKSNHGLEIIDCSNFSNINSVYTYTQTTYVTSLAFKDPFLYATDFTDGLHIFDLSDINDIQYVNNISIAGSAYSIDIVGQHAFIASNSTGIKIFDLIDPVNPLEVGNFTDGSSFFELDAIDNLVYAINDLYSLKIINVSNISIPTKIGEFNGSSYDDLVVSNDIAFISASSDGFSILNCSNPTTIVEMVNIDNQDFVSDIYVAQDYFYLTSWWNRGVEILSISSLPALQTVARIGEGYVTEIIIENNIAYLADEYGGVVIVNVSNPQSPVKLGVFNEGGQTKGICFSNNLLFVANYELGLQILNVEDPTHPLKLGSFYDGGNASGVTSSGNRAYLADGLDGFEIIDISNPESPIELVQGEDVPFITDYFTKIRIFEDKAYLLGWGGVFIFSIDEENGNTAGELLGSYFATNPNDFILKDDRVYISIARIDVVDVSNPESPLLVSYYTEAHFEQLLLVDDVLFASSWEEIYMLNITNPNQINKIGDFALNDPITDLIYKKGVLYISHSSSANDLQIITFDSDLDGLNDYEEENVYHTDPNNPDTDGDGLNDYEEVYIYSTDPLRADPDNDGLTDSEEIFYGTDPFNWDTDGDGYSDGQEIRRGSDPLDPLSVPSFRYWLLFVGLFSSLAFVALVAFLGMLARKKVIQRKELITQEKKQEHIVKEQKIFINLVTLDSGKDYSMEQIAEMLQLSTSEVKEIITLWSTSGVLDKIGSYDEDKDIFTKKATRKRTSKKFSCYYCSKKNNLGDTICSNCGFEIAICVSCDKPINYGELVASCPNCKTLNHLEHLAKHIKSHGHCPNCNKQLELGQLTFPLEHLAR